MVWLISFFTLAGYNFAFWILVGIIRFLYEKLPRPSSRKRGRPTKPILSPEVAAVVPAHNEELVIKRTIAALLRILPKGNIYVGSDYSTDQTVKIARSLGAQVLDIKPNLGKAKAIAATLKHFKLLSRYKLILINDADVEIDRNYLKRALPLFSDKKIATVAPHGVTRWRNYGFWEMIFIAYRARLWRVIQIGMRFGQTWKFTNVSFIVPGSLCLYRTRVLQKIKIDTPGLIIEDFNMTFELHRKKLGRIAYSPSVFGVHQDPYNLSDYVKQVKRWNLGFWQTVKVNGFWPSLFWLSTGSFILELTLYALFLLSVPFILVLFVYHSFQPLTLNISFISFQLTITDLVIGLLAVDYATTVIAAFMERKPILLLYGVGFIFLRYIDAFLHLYTLPLAFITQSTGIWRSPQRKLT